ncbi:uncharacterized protein [Montipora foliosa]|uniref:uncharacterized protein n=1 Tax=Montipora foliosa TaxID=591990 RepID=UPI0035F129DF
MPHYCCAGECYNSSNQKGLSWHKLPVNRPTLLSVWITKMRRDPRYLNVNEHTKICGEHFVIGDYVNPYSVKKRLKDVAVPSIFAWNKGKNQSEKRRSVTEKLEAIRTEEDEATNTASEGEGDPVTSSSGKDLGLVSRKTQTYEDDMCSSSDDHWRIPCSHKFSIGHLLSKCTTPKEEEKLFTHFTGFNSHETMFDGDCDDPGDFNDEEQNDICLTRPTAHKLPVEDEYLLVLMKLRMGLSVVDLGERFNIAESTVNNIFLTWINYLYVTLGSIKMWPHRDIILQNAPAEFLEKYPNNIVIIDATELKIEVRSALQKHSESYSTYKSHTTLKCLLGVDPKGGIMFISQLYEGSISDKQIVQRSGFLDILDKKVMVGEIKKGDGIMADKGFDIQNDLKKLGLQLNIPPFLKDKVGFEEDDVIKTQTIARHRIHVERAICKVRRFRIFHSVIPVSMLGCINQIWTVACLLSNFQNPVFA